MGKRKVFPTVDLAVPKVEHTRNQADRVVIHLDVIPPAEKVVRFPTEGNASPRRFYDFSRWYGAGIDAITYACQRQIERFLATHDGDLSVATVVGYCENGLRSFLDYLLIHSAAARRELVLGDINRDIVDGFLRFLEDDDRLATTSKKKRYDKVKAVLVAIGRRGLLRIVDGADEDSNTFPRNPFPNSNATYKGAIRAAGGRASRAQRDAKHDRLKVEQEKNRVLRAENKTMREQIAMLASINEVLQAENLELRARSHAQNVVEMGR